MSYSLLVLHSYFKIYLNYHVANTDVLTFDYGEQKSGRLAHIFRKQFLWLILKPAHYRHYPLPPDEPHIAPQDATSTTA